MDSTRHERLRQEAEAANAERDKLLAGQQSHRSGKHVIAFLSVGVLVLLVAAYVTMGALQPGPYDDFAKCLAEKGAIMYGADFCQYSKAQAGMFGKSFKFVAYKEYTETKGITVTPTWEVGGKRYEKVQSLEHLAALTGCTLP